MKHALPLLSLFFAMPVAAQDAVPATPAAAGPVAAPLPPAPKPATVRVSLQTAAGPIMLELEKERAPLTTAYFLRYVDQKRLDGGTFYRAMKLTPDAAYGLIQGGADPKKQLPPVAHEPTTKTGLSHVDGAVSLARGAPGSARSDFFIAVGALTSLDADPAKPGDNGGFAVFGRVVEGMDIVRKIMAAPTSTTKGEGVMRGQMIEAPIRITTARRAPAAP